MTNTGSSKPDPKKGRTRNKINFGRVEIELRTDILAFSAFILSLIALLPQVFKFFLVSNIIIFPPDNIMLKAYEFTKDSGKYVRFAATLTYKNTGHQIYSESVRNESATIEFIVNGKPGKFMVGGKNSHRWKYVWDVNVIPKRVEDDLSKIEMDVKGISIPFTVAGGKMVSHMTFFTPDQKNVHNFIKWDELETIFKKATQIRFKFQFTTFSGKSKHVFSYVRITPALIKQIKENDWAFPVTK